MIATTETDLWIIEGSTFQKLSLTTEDVRREIELMFIKKTLRMQKLKPPILLYPGFASSKLVAWDYKWCRGADIEVGENVWLSIGKVMQTVSTDAKCWLECLSLGANQTDPSECKLRAAQGISAVSELSPGLFTTGPSTIFGKVIQNMALDFKFDSNSMIAFPYDWRLSPDHLESRDSLFSLMKARIEETVRYNRHPAIAIAHSQGNNILLYFVEWLKLKYPDTYEEWIEGHIWCYIGFGAPLLGSLDGIKAHANGITMGLPITELQARDMAITFGSINWFTPLKFNDGTSHSNITVSWPEKMVKVIIDGKEREYNVEEINNGTLLKDLSEKIKDPSFKHLHRYHQENYLDAEVNPLVPPSRPPIKHIYQMYGINLDTDVALEFSLDKKTNTLKLEHTLTETAGGVLKRQQPGLVMPAVLDKNAGDLGHGRSGDATVPYSSLGWAHTWHSENVKKRAYPQKMLQYFRNPIGQWGEENVVSFMNTIDPAYTTYESSHVTEKGRTMFTTVLEMEGVDHRNVVKHEFTLKKMKDAIIQIIEEEYNFESSPFFSRNSSETPYKEATKTERNFE